MNEMMDPLPFLTTDGIFAAAFSSYLSTLLGTVFDAVQAPFSAALCVWIIVQGMLVMRGELSARSSVIRVVRAAIIYGLLSSVLAYENNVTNFFTVAIPQFVAGQVESTGQVSFSIPAECDLILATVQADFEQIGSSIGTNNNLDSSSYQIARTVLYGTLFLVFALYESATIFTALLVAIGPIFIVCYLFDATRTFAERWVFQLVNYGIVLLLVFTVGAVVLKLEWGYLFTESAIIAAMGTQPPTAGQVNYFWDLDIFLLMGDFLVLGIPAIAATLSGGLLQSRGELGGAAGLGGGSAPAAFAPALRSAGRPQITGGT